MVFGEQSSSSHSISFLPNCLPVFEVKSLWQVLCSQEVCSKSVFGFVWINKHLGKNLGIVWHHNIQSMSFKIYVRAEKYCIIWEKTWKIPEYTSKKTANKLQLFNLLLVTILPQSWRMPLFFPTSLGILHAWYFSAKILMPIALSLQS